MKLIRENRKARHEFKMFDKFEAGIELKGTEVKSLREGRVSIDESYCRLKNGELFLLNLDISQYQPGGGLNHAPKRPRKLLLHSYELDKILSKTQAKSVTIIPTKIYFNDSGRAKVEIAIASRMTKFDKREQLKKREIDRDIKGSMKRRR